MFFKKILKRTGEEDLKLKMGEGGVKQSEVRYWHRIFKEGSFKNNTRKNTK